MDPRLILRIGDRSAYYIRFMIAQVRDLLFVRISSLGLNYPLFTLLVQWCTCSFCD